MGSLLGKIRKSSNSIRHSYSIKKQAKWHYVGEGQQPPAPNALTQGEPVVATDFCHLDPTSILIP